MTTDSDLTPILTELSKRRPDVVFRSGKVVAWDTTTGENTVNVGGTELSDLPVLIATEKLAITAGDVVGILRVREQYFVLGRVNLDEGIIAVRDADGSITLRLSRSPAGGGTIATYYPNGESHAFMGQLYSEATQEVVGQGFLVQQEDGRDLLGVAPLTPGGAPLVRITDPLGDLSFTTNSVGGWTLWAPGTAESGVVSHLSPSETDRRLMDRPYQEVPMYLRTSSNLPEASGGSFSRLWQGRMYVTHPAIDVHLETQLTDAGTGQVSVDVDGVSLASPTMTNTSRQYHRIGPLLLPSHVRENPYAFYRVDVRARVTSGAGTLRVFMYGCTKRGL